VMRHAVPLTSKAAIKRGHGTNQAPTTAGKSCTILKTCPLSIFVVVVIVLLLLPSRVVIGPSLSILLLLLPLSVCVLLLSVSCSSLRLPDSVLSRPLRFVIFTPGRLVFVIDRLVVTHVVPW
jgi:hypothetical protein